MGMKIRLFSLSVGIDDNGLPIGELVAILIEIARGLTPQSLIEFLISLKLDFTEKDGTDDAFWRQKHPVNFKFCLFYPNRIESVSIGILRWPIDQFKQQGWGLLK